MIILKKYFYGRWQSPWKGVLYTVNIIYVNTVFNIIFPCVKIYYGDTSIYVCCYL